MIEVRELSKKFGSQVVLEQLDLRVEKGMTYCLLGKNGTGKTTLIHILVDLVKADTGEVLINGKLHNTLTPLEKKWLGLVGEDLALIEEINGLEYLNFIGKVYKLPKDALKKRIDNLVAYFFENEQDLQKNISTYSTGMRKKLAFCAAVLHAPDILILDEPFSGLDPLVANQMIAFIKRYQNNERAVFISSHDLNYIEKVGTHIGVLDKGKLLLNSTLQEFTENGANTLDVALLNILRPNDSELTNIDWL